MAAGATLVAGLAAVPAIGDPPADATQASAFTVSGPTAFGSVPVLQVGYLQLDVTNRSSSATALSTTTLLATGGTNESIYFAGPAVGAAYGPSCLTFSSTVGANQSKVVGVTVAAGGHCTLGIYFLPVGFGPSTAALPLPDDEGGTLDVPMSGAGSIGYWLSDPAAVWHGFGTLPHTLTDSSVQGHANPAHPVVGMASSPGGDGFWQVASDGGVFNNGDAPFDGSLGSVALNKPIVGIAASTLTNGYWLAGSDGGVFQFGGARLYGSLGSVALNKPIVGIAASPAGEGYWMVASDGGVFQFGAAPFEGSLGSVHLNQPIVGMAPTPDGKGYWLVAADGGIFQFGDAKYYGSLGSVRLNQPIVGMVASPIGTGYWLVARDGGVFQFNVPFVGSEGGTGATAVGMATDAGSPLDILLPFLLSGTGASASARAERVLDLLHDGRLHLDRVRAGAQSFSTS